MAESSGAFTRYGKRIFISVDKCVKDALTPRERSVYYELRDLRVKPKQTREIKWKNRPLILQPGQVFIVLRDFAKSVALTTTETHRVLSSMKASLFIHVLDVARGPGGGMILEVKDSDQMLRWAIPRQRKLEQLIVTLSCHKDLQSSKKLKSELNSLKQDLEQLRVKIRREYNRVINSSSTRDGTKFGTIHSYKNILGVLNRDAAQLEMTFGEIATELSALDQRLGKGAPDGASSDAANAAQAGQGEVLGPSIGPEASELDSKTAEERLAREAEKNLELGEIEYLIEPDDSELATEDEDA